MSKSIVCIYENHPIWERGEFEKKINFDNLIGSHQLKKIIY
jgi:hypothetical protein